MEKTKRRILVGMLAVVMLLAGALPAFATNPRASCVGFVSELATAGQLEVSDLKASADAFGAPNFGLFVAEGAKLHLGSLAACLP